MIDLVQLEAAGEIVRAPALAVRLPAAPRRYYYHGWQSWSPAIWTDTELRLPTPHPKRLHPMQFDPAHIFEPHPHGSGLAAVEMEDGGVVLLGALGMDAHVELAGNEVRGTYEGTTGEWFVDRGDERSVFARYARELGKRLGKKSSNRAPRVWCSWYSLFTAIDEPRLARVFDGLGDLPFDVLQVDDGWQQSVGDWEANAKFSSGMQTLAQRIKATGRRAGLWLAPLIAVKSSRLFRQHRDWFLRDARGRLVSAGFNWGEQLYALDTTHPLVIQWLKGLMQKTRAWGYDYLKLDFLYAGALPGQRHTATAREMAYRESLETMREVLGEDAFLLACGAPILPSLGVCDALRIGPDTAPQWESQRDAVLLHNPAIPGTRNAIRTTLNRMWLKPLVHIDPDVVYFRSVDCDLTPQQKNLLQSLALVCDFRATSDLPQWLGESERDSLREFLTARPRIEQTGARSFKLDGRELDYSSVMELTATPGRWTAIKGAAFGWLANHTWTLRIDHELGKRNLRQRMKDAF